MARREALLRLHKTLASRRDELRRRLGGEMKNLRNSNADPSGDAADLAFDSGNEEVASQLAELESRELRQIERAMAKLKRGTYGQCEACQKKIPVMRLNALPYSTMCIECQREAEVYGGEGGRGGAAWDKVSDADVPLEEQKDVDISSIEMDLSSSR